MTDQPAADLATRRFITRLLILDAIFVPVCVGALIGYRIGHVGWLLWLGLAGMAVLAAGVFWLARDLKRSRMK